MIAQAHCVALAENGRHLIAQAHSIALAENASHPKRPRAGTGPRWCYWTAIQNSSKTMVDRT